jgi:5-formyltetrahydrofolate cyclo-ligase
MSFRVPEVPPSAGWDEIRQWRKLVRKELLERRAALSVEALRATSERACTRLRATVDLGAFKVLGFCWPFRGEFDVRGIAKDHIAGGGEVALPVIVEKSAPVEFWRWYPGMPMQKGIWDIPVPKEREVVTLDAVIVPLVGFDESGYRLGYGGGYFDRTLAAARRRPYAIGFGYEDSRLPSIHPQRHDIPMHLIVTDQAVHRSTR